jgi:hypothetical protein
MRAILKNIFCAALGAVLLSCVTDPVQPVDPPAKPRTVSFALSTFSGEAPSTRGVTRAIEDIVANEGVVNRLDIFFYPAVGETQACLFYPENSALDHDRDAERVTITIPEDVYEDLDAADFVIYVVANLPESVSRADLAGKTLAQVKAMVAENSPGMAFNGDNAPEQFLMTGASSAIDIAPDGQFLGNITLKRAAAKIVVNITKADISGYTPGAARVRLTNYLDKTVIGHEGQYDAPAEDYHADAWRNLRQVAGGEPGVVYAYEMDIENSLYTYSNDWRDRADRETYITLELEWFEGSSTDPVLYYYRIPFSFINAVDPEAVEANRDRIRRNHVYAFDLDVTMLGGLDPEDALDLEANFDVIDWNTREVKVSILAFDYLFVYNPVVTTSAGSHRYEYRSSVTLTGEQNWEITRAECTAYLGAAGTPTLINYLNGGDPPGNARLTVALVAENGRTYLDLGAWVPVNYVPLEIELTIDNGEGLTADVALTIMPPIYVTVTRVDPNNLINNGMFYGSGAYTSPTGTGTSTTLTGDNPGMSSGVQNDRFYEISTTTLTGQMILIATGQPLPMQVGDPTILMATGPFTGGNNPAIWQAVNPEYRRTDPEMQHVVSPRFIMASRRGAHNPFAYTSAAERCARYREAQYPAGTWRVPTYAELALISIMQRDDESAIKDLLSTSAGATTWWTARNTTSIEVSRYNDYLAANGVNTSSNQTTRNVRCVRDTWRTYPQDYFEKYGVYRNNLP